jgi:hypothetical protein
MKTRKAVYILRGARRRLTAHGRLTIETDAALTEPQRRAAIARLVRSIRRSGIEASPKLQEIHR